MEILNTHKSIPPLFYIVPKSRYLYGTPKVYTILRSSYELHLLKFYVSASIGCRVEDKRRVLRTHHPSPRCGTAA